MIQQIENRDYQSFLASKRISAPVVGFDVPASELNPLMKPWQRVISRWSIRRGRAALFLDTGLGKTIQQLQAGDSVCKETGGNFLILSPLAVSRQTVLEAAKFGVTTPVNIASSGDFIQPGITVTNYEKLHKFDVSKFVGVALDEASILKSIDGKTRNLLIESFARTPYRFVYTATPSPNDLTEIGSYAEFLGIMSGAEMKAMFFTHDGGDTSKWRLRRHAEKDFFRWMATWSVMIRKPSDLGFNEPGYDLPPLNIHEHIVADDAIPAGHLFQIEAKTLQEQRESRRNTIPERVAIAAKLAKDDPSHWIIWCNLNDESKAASTSISDAIEITGSMKDSDKELQLIRFSDRQVRVIVTKPDIAGFGLNWQHCCNMAFLGLSHSYEQFYQAVRRSWRFGQTDPVNVHLIISDRDGEVLHSVQRKQAEADRMTSGMIEAMADFSRAEIASASRETTEYKPEGRMDLSLWR